MDDTLDRFQWTIGILTAYKNHDKKGLETLLDGMDSGEVIRNLLSVLSGFMDMLSMVLEEPMDEMLQGLSMTAEEVWSE